MVVRMKTPPSKKSEDSLRGVQTESKDSSMTELEFSRLKNLVPSISKKTTVSKLDVILEAIRYIDQLQDQLLDQVKDFILHFDTSWKKKVFFSNWKQFFFLKFQIAEKRICPKLAVDLLVGKENKNTDFIKKIQEEKRLKEENDFDNEDEDDDV